MQLDRNYWETRYSNSETGWDLGGPSTPLKAYIDQLTDKDLRILIPGAGRAYEAEYAHGAGFKNVYVIDLTDSPFKELLERCPGFPREHLIVGDLFEHHGSYDRILEQTFFCALDPTLRTKYVAKIRGLLKPNGKLVGVLFDDPLNSDHPPFGGNREEYVATFGPVFEQLTLKPCYNSITPRAGRELWLSAIRNEDAYEPIDCSLYDRYEAAATLKQRVRFNLKDGSCVEGIIRDLFIRNKVEMVRLDPEKEVRLDHINSFKVL